MKLAASDARKAMLCATSSASPGRPRACVCWHLSRNWWWRRLTEWGFKHVLRSHLVDRCCLAETLQDHYAATELYCHIVLPNRPMNKWIPSMGIASKWHWRFALPVYTAAHRVRHVCGHLWWWRQGWQRATKDTKAGSTPDVHFQIVFEGTRRRCYSPHRVHPHLLTCQFWNALIFIFNDIRQRLWGRTCSRSSKTICSPSAVQRVNWSMADLDMQ